MHEESSEELLALVDLFKQKISVLKSLSEPAAKWSSLLGYLMTIHLEETAVFFEYCGFISRYVD